LFAGHTGVLCQKANIQLASEAIVLVARTIDSFDPTRIACAVSVPQYHQTHSTAHLQL
jgi:hypothetical protein